MSEAFERITRRHARSGRAEACRARARVNYLAPTNHGTQKWDAGIDYGETPGIVIRAALSERIRVWGDTVLDDYGREEGEETGLASKNDPMCGRSSGSAELPIFVSFVSEKAVIGESPER